MNRICISIACLASSLAVAGCSDDGTDAQRPLLGVGTLELAWSIDGRQDASVCEEVGAVAFEAVIFDQGYFVGDVEARCDAFVASTELYVDDYLVRSTLLDVEGYAALRRVVEDFSNIEEDRITRLTMDFPSTGAPMDPVLPDAGAALLDAGAALPDAGPTDAPP